MRRRQLLSLAAGSALAGACAARDKNELLHVSFDATRELFAEVNETFAASDLRIRQSHGGSGKQTRSVMEGLQADVVSLALGFDVDALAKAGLLASDWRSRMPFESSPLRSTVVLLVRAGNPKGISGFGDLARDDVSVITPNPKTSGGARWNHLAIWDFALRETGNRGRAEDFMRAVYSHVPVLDSGARGAMTTFAKRRIGDVLIAWESEARVALSKFKGAVEVVVPSRSVRADIPVAVLDKVVDHRGTRATTERYAAFLFSETAQAIFPRFGFRPAESDPADFARVEFFNVTELGDSWASLHEEHFAEGALFDRVSDRS
ncbi:MAG: sulfate ABC transporter substrate-binding protein [Polyangiaceae bacterium]